MVWTVMEPDIKVFIFAVVKNRMNIDFEENHNEWRRSESGKSWIIDTGVGCFDENRWDEQLLPHDPLYPVILIKLVCVSVILYSFPL